MLNKKWINKSINNDSLVAHPQSGSSSTGPDRIGMLVVQPRVPGKEGGKLIFVTPW